MVVTVECDDCGTLEFEGISGEEIRDQIAEHLMLVHGQVEWEEHGDPPS